MWLIQWAEEVIRYDRKGSRRTGTLAESSIKSSNMKRTTAEQEVSICYHIICMVLTYFAILHDQDSKFDWFTYQRFGGKWKYMSHLLLYAIAAYTVYAIIVDVINILEGHSDRPGDDKKPFVAIARDSVFNEILLPFGLGHSFVYVFTSLIDNGLFISLINRRKETFLSYYMLFLHVFPLIFCLLESALVYHKPSHKGAFKIPFGLAILYDIWMLVIAWFGSYWSYPFLRRASTFVKILCLALFPVIIAGCHFLGTKLNHYLWGMDVATAEIGGKQKDD